MACGVHLGIFLVCLVQAEHVRCLWATQAQSFKRQNSNAYVGFSQQDSGLRRQGGSYLQNQFRQASTDPDSAQSSSFNMQTGYSQGLSSRDYTQGVSQPAQNSYASVKAGKSSLLSNPNWKPLSLTQLNVQKVPKDFGLSTSIGSGTTVQSSHKKQNSPINRRTWPVQGGTQRTSQYLPSSSASVQSPRESYSFRQTAAQKPSSTANEPAYYWQGSDMISQMQAPKDFSPRSSRLFSPRAPQQQGKVVQMQTSASAPARRVSSHQKKAPKKPFNFSTSNGRTGYSPSQSLSTSIYQQKVSSNYRAGTSGQRFAPTETHNIPDRFGGFAIRRLKDTDQKEESTWKPQQTYTAPTQQTVSYKPQQTYTAPTQQTVSYKPQVQRVHNPSKWLRVRPQVKLQVQRS